MPRSILNEPNDARRIGYALIRYTVATLLALGLNLWIFYVIYRLISSDSSVLAKAEIPCYKIDPFHLEKRWESAAFPAPKPKAQPKMIKTALKLVESSLQPEQTLVLGPARSDLAIDLPSGVFEGAGTGQGGLGIGGALDLPRLPVRQPVPKPIPKSIAATQFIPIDQTKPFYPTEAIVDRIEGWVELRFTITASGSVADARVTQAFPSAIFNDSALAGVKLWRYRPRLEQGRAVDTPNVAIRVRFDLRNVGED